MRKVVIDTNVYIDWLNHKKFTEIIFHSEAVKYLSTVVLMELRAGADTADDQSAVADLASTFRRVNRVLIPSASTYEEAGRVLQLLRAKKIYEVTKAYSLANDVLIALSARQIGGTVITQNRADYTAILALSEFKLEIVAQAES